MLLKVHSSRQNCTAEPNCSRAYKTAGKVGLESSMRSILSLTLLHQVRGSGVRMQARFCWPLACRTALLRSLTGTCWRLCRAFCRACPSSSPRRKSRRLLSPPLLQPPALAAYTRLRHSRRVPLPVCGRLCRALAAQCRRSWHTMARAPSPRRHLWPTR